MTDITSPVPRTFRHLAWTGSLANAGRWILDFLAMITAAGRVANALEARREPATADLRALGIPGKLPSA